MFFSILLWSVPTPLFLSVSLVNLKDQFNLQARNIISQIYLFSNDKLSSLES